jgi:hypothetical protein
MEPSRFSFGTNKEIWDGTYSAVQTADGARVIRTLQRPEGDLSLSSVPVLVQNEDGSVSRNPAAARALTLSGAKVGLWGDVSPSGQLTQAYRDMLVQARVRAVPGAYEVDLGNGKVIRTPLSEKASVPAMGTRFGAERWVILQPLGAGFQLRWASPEFEPAVTYCNPVAQPTHYLVLDRCWNNTWRHHNKHDDHSRDRDDEDPGQVSSPNRRNEDDRPTLGTQGSATTARPTLGNRPSPTNTRPAPTAPQSRTRRVQTPTIPVLQNNSGRTTGRSGFGTSQRYSPSSPFSGRMGSNFGRNTTTRPSTPSVGRPSGSRSSGGMNRPRSATSRRR